MEFTCGDRLFLLGIPRLAQRPIRDRIQTPLDVDGSGEIFYAPVSPTAPWVPYSGANIQTGKGKSGKDVKKLCSLRS